MPVGPNAQTAVFRQAIAANARPRKDEVGVRGPHLDRFNDLLQIDLVPLGEQGPFIEESEDSGAVAVFDDLGGLGFDGAVQNGEREFIGVQHLVEELGDKFAGGFVDAAAHAPEVPNGGDVILAGHDAFVTMRQQRLGTDAPLLEDLLHDRVGNLFRGSGGDGGFNQDERGGRDVLRNRRDRGFQGGHLGRTGADVAQRFLQVIALDIHHDHVGQFQGLFRVGGYQRLLVVDAAGDELLDLRVLGLDWRDAAVEQPDLPEAAGAGALDANDELRGPAFLVRRIGHDGGHDGPDKPEADDHHDFLPGLALLGGQRAQPGEFLLILLARRQWKLLP